MSNILKKNSKNVIYTSFGFGRNNNSFDHFQNKKWAQIQRKKIKEYCRINSINLKVIDYKNKYMEKILDNFVKEKSFDDKPHEIYTLSAIAAIYDFLYSENSHLNFFWMHLDMAINQMRNNIFDFFDIKKDEAYCSVAINSKDEYPRRDINGNIELIDWDKDKLKLLQSLSNHSNLKIDAFGKDFTMYNCSIIALNKKTAKTFVETLDSVCNIFSDEFECSTPVIEETVFELVHLYARKNNIDLHFKSDIDLLKQEYRNFSPFGCYPDYKNKMNPNLTFIHFTLKENKDKIVDFYKNKLEK
jgi:hypothetical protein